MEFKINFSGKAHTYTDDEIQTVIEAMRSADPLTQGKYRDTFEQAFCAYNGSKYAFSVCNATAALEMAAQMCLFEEGDEIVAPSHTFTSSVYPFVKKGARVKWADIDITTRVVTLNSIKKCITSKTKAIVVVHLYGFIIPEIEAIALFAQENRLLLIEDVAQAMGTEINGRKAGTFGDFGIFSFHSHKNITTLGEGGMLTVKTEKYANIIPLLRHNGHCGFDYPRSEYWLPAMGNLDLPNLDGYDLMPNNYCLGEIECALGTKLLERLDTINNEKRSRALAFIDALQEYPILQFHRVDDKRHNYHLLVASVQNSQRDNIMRKLAYEYKIKCVVQYYPLNRYPLYQKLGFGEAVCPNADHFFDNMISFPFHHWMSDTEFDYMLQSTISVLKEL